MSNKLFTEGIVKYTSWFICFFALSSASSFASSDINPFDSTFVAYHDGKKVGEAHLSLKHIQDNEFELSYASKVSKFFLSDRRYETTLFEVQDDTLVPTKYRYKREGTGPNKKTLVQFDKDSNMIMVNKEPKFEWNNEIDNQLFRIDLSNRIKQGDTQFQYDFINYSGQKRQYNLSVVSTDSLSLPYGQITAVKVRIDRESKKRVTYAWYAPDLDYTLVRLQQFKEGNEQGDIKLLTFSKESEQVSKNSNY